MTAATPSTGGQKIATSVIQWATLNHVVLVAGCSSHSRSNTTTAKAATHIHAERNQRMPRGKAMAGSAWVIEFPNTRTTKKRVRAPALTNGQVCEVMDAARLAVSTCAEDSVA